MKEERRNRVEKRNWKSRGKIILGIMFFSFLAAIVLYVVMIQTEKKLLDSEEKKTVYVAKKEIPKGMVLNFHNWAEYVEEKEMEVNLIPGTVINEIPVNDMVVSWTVEEGVFLTTGMFADLNLILSDMKEPVLAGFRAEDIYQVVGGVLRAGDRIHIYCVDKEKQETILLWENIYVQQVFDNSGVRIEPEDDKSCAQRINVYLEQKDVKHFYEELHRGEVRVVKVL